jgi:hypothetical protein
MILDFCFIDILFRDCVLVPESFTSLSITGLVRLHLRVAFLAKGDARRALPFQFNVKSFVY